MFGTKLRTWMEAHIVRSKKKKDRKKGDKGFDSNCNSPRSHSANRSPALHQVHPVNSPSKNVDGIRLHGGNYGATVTTSSGTSGGTGSVSLSSPESAYSTGYSTDGTSPGTSFPPEYYINIRTGTHYFQSSGGGGGGGGGGSGSNNNNNNNNNNSGGVGGKARPKRVSGDVTNPSSAAPGNGRVDDRAQSASTTNMTKDNGQPEVRTSTPHKSAEISHAPRQQHQQQPQQQQQQQQSRQQENSHRRTESYSAESSRNSLPVPSSIPPPLVSPPVQSPRERSRIRTNPWLSANSSGSSTNGLKSRLALDESSSSSGGLKLTESSGSASDVNLNMNGRELTAGESIVRRA